MRLHFPNKEHDDMLVAHGDTSIGAASDNSLVLDRPGISPHHASISVGDRGYAYAGEHHQEHRHSTHTSLLNDRGGRNRRRVATVRVAPSPPQRHARRRASLTAAPSAIK